MILEVSCAEKNDVREIPFVDGLRNPPAWGPSPGDLQLGRLLVMGRAPHWHWWGSNRPFLFTVLVSPGPWLRRLGGCDGRRCGKALQTRIPCEGTLQARSPVKCKPYGKTFPVKHEPGGRKFHVAISNQYLSAIGLTRQRGVVPAAQVFVDGWPA